MLKEFVHPGNKIDWCRSRSIAKIYQKINFKFIILLKKYQYLLVATGGGRPLVLAKGGAAKIDVNEGDAAANDELAVAVALVFGFAC